MESQSCSLCGSTFSDIALLAEHLELHTFEASLSKREKWVKFQTQPNIRFGLDQDTQAADAELARQLAHVVFSLCRISLSFADMSVLCCDLSVVIDARRGRRTGATARRVRCSVAPQSNGSQWFYCRGECERR